MAKLPELHTRTIVILVLVGALGSITAVPYFYALFGDGAFSQTLGYFGTHFLIFMVSTALTLACVYFGLNWATGIGLGAPRLQNWAFNRADPAGWRESLAWGIPIGIVIAVILWVAEAYWFAGMFSKGHRDIGLAKGIAAAIYGGTAEELLLRLFVMTGIARLLLRMKVTRTNAVINALVLAAVFSFAFHLPAAYKTMGVSWPVLGHTVVHYGIPALVFGWLYWRRGIEAAMIAHGLSDMLAWIGLYFWQR